MLFKPGVEPSKYNITEELVSSAISDLYAQNQHFPQTNFSDDYRMATCSNQGFRIHHSDTLGDRALSTKFEQNIMAKKLS